MSFGQGKQERTDGTGDLFAVWWRCSVMERDLDAIKTADGIIDLGSGGGSEVQLALSGVVVGAVRSDH